jgi:4-amino-4-deoxy-L-arabinose transferase-like glycosyltransferase
MLHSPEAPAPTPPSNPPSPDSPASPSSGAGSPPLRLRATPPAVGDEARANGAAPGPLGPPRAAVLDRWRRDGMLALLGLAMVKLIVQLAVAGRYGFHRDELYYLAAGRHPSLGYVDYPPLTAMVARLSTLVFGHSLVGLRVWPALAGAAVVVLGGLIARELGGGRLAQVLAGFLVLCSPMFLGSNSMLQTVSFDELAWAVCLYLAARLVARGGPPRLWLAIGVAFGIGLETKYTILLLAMGLAVGLVLTAQRRWLATPWPWLAALIAGALLAPNLVWQATHGWPTLEFLGNHNAEMAAENPPTRFLAEQLLLIGFAVVPLWIAGFVHLLRRPRFRMLGLAAAAVILVLLLQRAKSYYAGPVYPLLLAAGAVSFERFLRRQESPVQRRRRVRALIAALLVSSVVAAPFALPVLPAQQMVRHHLDELRDDYAEMVGWPELVGTVAGVYRSLPPAERATARVLAANYGEAGAVDWFGPRLGLPVAISGHDTYWFWRPRQRTTGPLITLGYERSELRGLCGDLRQVATITNRVGAANEERGGPVFVCRDPRGPLESWPSFRRFVS